LPVWPNADVSWCQDLSDPRFIIGNLLRDGPEQVYAAYAPFKTRTIAGVATANGVCGECSLLSFCGTGCRVGALGAGGEVEDPDPGACRLHRERLYLPVMNALRTAVNS
jgi:radical SAM protein with 4Fe4S-binding SPASM domain